MSGAKVHAYWITAFGPKCCALGALILTVGCAAYDGESIEIGRTAGNGTISRLKATGPHFVSFEDQRDAEGLKSEVVYSLRNVGDKPVEITLAEQSCTCTGVELTSPIVSPGTSEEARITVALTPHSGKQVQHVLLTMDHGEPKTIALALECYKYATLAISPDITTRMTVPLGETKRVHHKLGCYRPTSDAETVLSARAFGDGLSVSVANQRSRNIGNGVREVSADLILEIGCDSGHRQNEQSVQRGSIVVSANEYCELTKHIVWSADLPIRAIPAEVLVQPSAAGNSTQIYLRGEEPFRITDVTTGVDWLTARVERLSEDREHVIVLRSSPDSAITELADRAWVTVHTDFERQRTVRVPVYTLNALRPSEGTVRSRDTTDAGS